MNGLLAGIKIHEPAPPRQTTGAHANKWNSPMRHLKLLSLLSVPLALLVGCGGGGNNVGHTAQVIAFDNPGTQTVGAPLTISAMTNSGLTVSFTSATPSVCTVS